MGGSLAASGGPDVVVGGTMMVAGLAVLLFALGAPSLTVASAYAPPQGPTPRTQFVFHVYVDPIFGDNEQAFALNPGNPLDLSNPPVDPGLAAFPGFLSTVTRPVPLDRRSDFNTLNSPENSTNPNFALTGFLQHAPYSFRTLTGQFGAMEYVYRVFDDPNLIGPAPWPRPHPSNTRVVKYVVVHCLPGLYGPRNPLLSVGTPDVDPISGLPWNGEVFPVLIGRRLFGDPDKAITDFVSIQGALWIPSSTRERMIRLFRPALHMATSLK
jgi:hypothetical protein